MTFRSSALAVVGFAVAMACLEAAVVVYLQGALGGKVGEIFPIRPELAAGALVQIEVGREAATMVMIGAVGVLVGLSRLERLAWSAVVFGVWDIGYYAWLQVFSGWPGSLHTTDLLFLIPVPWVGPVWSPVLVSAALIGFGLSAASMLRAGKSLTLRRGHWIAGLLGGLLVILSWTLDSGGLLDGAMPGPYPWPIFVIGMLLALAAAIDALRRLGLPRGAESTRYEGAQSIT